MLTSRAIIVQSIKSCRSVPAVSRCWFSTPAVKPEEEEEGALSPVAKKVQAMRKANKFQIMGPAKDDFLPSIPLPEDPSEVRFLDPADLDSRLKRDGSKRTVVIRQDSASIKQAPLNPESKWRIAMFEDGAYAQETWKNELMGWTSSSDPYQCEVPLEFTNAMDAVYFAKKRGWEYVVEKPILRKIRDDDVGYEHNFLPQDIQAQVEMEGTGCRQWERKSSGTSHYFRPLKYHGDGTVRQHGAAREQATDKAPEGYYKMR